MRGWFHLAYALALFLSHLVFLRYLGKAVLRKCGTLLHPAFSKKSEVTWYLAFRGVWWVVRVSEFDVGTIWTQLPLQFQTDPSET